MSIQMKNGCLVYYGNLIGYQAKNQTEVTVDPQFRREELESWLARRGLVPRWEEGVYERLSNEGFRVSDSSPELQSCRIWQLKPGTPIQMRFIGLDAMAQKFGGPTPEQYHVVYDGRIQDNDLEKLWNKFSRTPLGPDGQPLATADLAVGDYIINTKLSDVPAADNAYLYDLDGSQQAISVTIRSFANGLSGKLQSGDIVSVVAPDYKQQGQTVIPPELQYVEVISVTASTGYDANTGEAQTDDEDGKELPSTVTLLVTPEQSKVLAELEEEGTIHLTLVYRGSKENAEKFLTAQNDVLLELYPPEPDPEEASQEETTQEETPTGTDNPEETEVETPTESEEVV